MTENKRIGIYGVGIFLPEPVRKNDWWPPSVVEKWRERIQSRPPIPEESIQTEGMRRALAGMSEVRDDPFRGMVERRVMPEGMTCSDMQTFAARDVITRSGFDTSHIDLLLANSQLPDYLTVPISPIVHQNLGLPQKCFTLDTEGACNSFLLQLEIAEQLIKGGVAHYGLLLQASGALHIQRPEDNHSAWFGDAATAVLVGPVRKDRGVLASVHRTDGSLCRALVTGSPGSKWYEGEKIFSYMEDPPAAWKMLTSVADLGKQVVDEALRLSGFGPLDVDFYATHQATHWFRKVTQEHIGLTRAKSFDSYSWTGSLGSANIPMMLGLGEREGLLRDGNLVAMYTGGSGITWSGVVMRWGS